MPTPPEAGPDETRQRIIQAALQLFSEVGYRRATTRAIAAAAGINEVTLFRHFGNKQNLLAACVEESNTGGFAGTFAHQLTGRYADDIRIMARAQMADMVARFGALRLFMCDAQDVPELKEVLVQGARQNAGLLAGYFRQQAAAGIVRGDVDPATLARAFDSMFSSYVFFQTLLGPGGGPELPPDDVIQPLADIFVKGTIQSAAKEF